MSIAKSDLESQARRWSGNVDGTRRSFSQASYPNLPDYPKLKLNPNLRRRWRSISEASNLNLLSLSEDLFDYSNRNLLSLSDFRKPSLKPKRRGRKPNPNPRRRGRLSREDLGKQQLLLLQSEQQRLILQTEQRLILQAEQLFISDASVTPNTTKEELSASPSFKTSEITFTKEELSLPPTFTKEELSAPPTAEMLDRIYGPDDDWFAELQRRNNKCGLCGCTNHLTFTCSYFEEIPPDAKILNETIIEIVCRYCSLPFKNGTCLSKCLPPIRRKAIPNFIEVIPKSRKAIPYPFEKEMFVAPPSSEMVVHSSSEETTIPCIHDLSTSPSLKLSEELDAGLTFPYTPALQRR